MGPGAKILLEEKATDGKIYAVCPIETYPGLAIQSVADSSRWKTFSLSLSFTILLWVCLFLNNTISAERPPGILWSKWWREGRRRTLVLASLTEPTASTWTPPSTITSRGSRSAVLEQISYPADNELGQTCSCSINFFWFCKSFSFWCSKWGNPMLKRNSHPPAH